MEIRSLGPERWLDEPVFAINWFHAKRPSLYDLYNRIASPAVFRAGGKVFFKALVGETLHGDGSSGRDTLLIVGYPAVASFLELVENRFFQVVSPLREAAVRKFSFVMQRRSVGAARLTSRIPRFNKRHAFAMHIFGEGSSAPVRSIEELTRDVEALLPGGATVHYAGQAAAEVVIHKRGAERPMRHVTTQLIIVEADDRAALRAALTADAYQAFVERSGSGHVALLRRKL